MVQWTHHWDKAKKGVQNINIENGDHERVDERVEGRFEEERNVEQYVENMSKRKSEPIAKKKVEKEGRKEGLKEGRRNGRKRGREIVDRYKKIKNIRAGESTVEAHSSRKRKREKTRRW